ncbi:MAG: hypothetical protein QM779_01125 [Propionicimonas sp.]|uniref:hypothetical protein n=1 Tax=Propionicimonas sp. TaxID=1955623 RepID=UPI003D0CDDD5
MPVRSRPSRWRRGLSATVTALALSLTTGCFENISSSIDQATQVIDDGIRSLNANSSAWRAILQKVADDLPEDISETIRVDAQSLVNRSIATAGVEFRCNVDFLGHRAIQSLEALKAKLLGQNPAVLPPGFCQADPAAIDLNVDPGKWSTLMLYGYDLDHADVSGNLFTVSLVTANGQSTALPESRIGRTTHYQVTVNLGSLAPQLYQQGITKIAVAWNGSAAGYPEAVVVPWNPPQQTILQKDLGSTRYTPPRVGGDADFDTDDDEPTDVQVGGELSVQPDRITSRVSLHARERDPDHTEVNGTSDWAAAYLAPANWRIVSVSPTGASTATAVATSHDVLKLSRPGGEVVDLFDVWVDRDGDEAGSYTSVEAHWRRVDIVLQQVAPSWAS